MKKKIIWLILIFLVLLLGGSYYFYSFKNQGIVNNQNQDKEEFLEFLLEKEKLPRVDEEVSLIAVGDISYSRGVERIVRGQNNIHFPFLKIQDYFKSADLVFGNLETPITPGSEVPALQMIFRSNPGTEEALKEAGFSILSLANNHTPNFGEKGLRDTFSYLDNVGIKYIGAGENEREAYQIVYFEEKGIKFAFLAYNDDDVVPDFYEASADRSGTAFMRIEKMVEAVKEAKENADFVIISMHSGIEYVQKPNDSQINFAHTAIDAGADLIIGHHPHVVQTMEKYKGKFIFYSLGNFIFDQPQLEETRESLVLKVYFSKEGISKISLLPVVMENLAQPRMAEKDRADKILGRLDYPLEDQIVYFWNRETNNFYKGVKKVIYNDLIKTSKIISKKEEADLDNNSIFENYNLENGRLTISEDGKTIWQSEDGWWVDDFVLADSNNDGVVDINLSLWRSGDFGTSKPFWVEDNDMSVKNHFFVLDFSGGVVKQVWGSSNLVNPICEFKIADIDNDGKNELILVEGDYLLWPKCLGNYVAVWKWNEWGFFNEWRSEEGEFINLEIEKIEGENYIVVDTY